MVPAIPTENIPENFSFRSAATGSQTPLTMRSMGAGTLDPVPFPLLLEPTELSMPVSAQSGKVSVQACRGRARAAIT